APAPVIAGAATGECERAGEGYRGERGEVDSPAGSVLCHEGDLRLSDFLVTCPQTRAGFPIVSSAVPGSHTSRDALKSRQVLGRSMARRAGLASYIRSTSSRKDCRDPLIEISGRPT